MNRFKVVLQGVQNNSPEGWAEFCRRFGEAYQMDLEGAINYVESHEQSLYTCEDEPSALKAVDFLERIGGIATLIEEQPGAASPASSAPDGPPRKCLYCGAQAPGPASACPQCGRPFPIKSEVDRHDPRVREQVRLEKAGLTGKSRCLYCGETFDRAAQLTKCPHCGRKIQNAGRQAQDEATQLAGIYQALTDD